MIVARARNLFDYFKNAQFSEDFCMRFNCGEEA